MNVGGKGEPDIGRAGLAGWSGRPAGLLTGAFAGARPGLGVPGRGACLPCRYRSTGLTANPVLVFLVLASGDYAAHFLVLLAGLPVPAGQAGRMCPSWAGRTGAFVPAAAPFAGCPVCRISAWPRREICLNQDVCPGQRDPAKVPRCRAVGPCLAGPVPRRQDVRSSWHAGGAAAGEFHIRQPPAGRTPGYRRLPHSP